VAKARIEGEQVPAVLPVDEPVGLDLQVNARGAPLRLGAGPAAGVGAVLTAGVGAVLIGGVLAAVDEAQPFLTVTVVDEDDDEFGIDDRHRLVSGDGNGEVREVVQPGAEGRMFSSLASARAEVSSIPPMMQLRPERRPTATATASSESNSRGGTAEP